MECGWVEISSHVVFASLYYYVLKKSRVAIEDVWKRICSHFVVVVLLSNYAFQSSRVGMEDGWVENCLIIAVVALICINAHSKALYKCVHMR